MVLREIVRVQFLVKIIFQIPATRIFLIAEDAACRLAVATAVVAQVDGDVDFAHHHLLLSTPSGFVAV